MKKKKSLIAKFPLYFVIRFIHNHEINRQDHKRFRPVSHETKEEFIILFEDDLTPSAAWEQHRKRVQEKFPDDYPIKFGDQPICTDYFWVCSPDEA